MSDPTTELVAESSARRSSRLLLAILCVLIVAVAVRRRLIALARRSPYVRRRARVESPALIVNRWSGGGKAERFGLVDAAERAGVRTIMLERGDDISELARTAIADGADAIGSAGGDGTMGLVAKVAAEHDVPFFCVPVGTRNHFALDLGLDRDDPLTALDAITEGDELLVDLGMAGDRPFVNNVSFGVYAEAVHRDEYRDNKERTLAEVIAELGAGPDPGKPLSFETPSGETAERTAVTLVSNNPYVISGPPDFGRRIRLDSGELGIGTLSSGRGPDGSAGTAYRSWTARQLRLTSEAPILAGLDGEAVTFDSPLEIEIRRRGLRVLVPAGVKPGFAPDPAVFRSGLAELAHLAGVPGRVGDRGTAG